MFSAHRRTRTRAPAAVARSPRCTRRRYESPRDTHLLPRKSSAKLSIDTPQQRLPWVIPEPLLDRAAGTPRRGRPPSAER
eukprot:828054-Pyramimonas_sp.AAC.1